MAETLVWVQENNINDLTELNDLCKTAQANAQAAYERLSQAEDELYKTNEQIHYRNVFLEDYSELEMEIAELDTLIEDLSAYMQSTGKKYADHAATLRSWSARKRKQQKPGTGIPDYNYNEEESL